MNRMIRVACLAGLMAGVAPVGAEESAPATQPATAAEAAPAAAAEPTSAPQPADAAPTAQLLVEDLRPGFGEVATPGMRLAVHYTGWLYQADALGYRGKQFDSSRDRGQAFVFGLGEGRVIKGWEAGVAGMKVGGLRRLVIPPDMAYGDRNVGNGLIPPGSTLVFEVELLGVESRTLTEGAK
jgi:FKBP-type peptidyl-prolyl cis-trans isomerase FkpA